MSEKITAFIDELRKYLGGMNEDDAREAVLYYEEYLMDASEAGEDLEKVILSIGPAKKLAATIKTEASIKMVRKEPGIRNYAKVLKNAFHFTTTPLKVLLFGAFALCSLSLVAAFFISSVVLYSGALLSLLYMINEAAPVFSRYPLEAFGTLGIGLIAASALFVSGYVFFKISRYITRLFAIVVGFMFRTGRHEEKNEQAVKPARKSFARKAVVFCCILFAAGIALAIVSGIPIRFFILYNSMESPKAVSRQESFNTASISKVSVKTGNSRILLTKGTGDTITLAYKLPEWLDPSIRLQDGTLSFSEEPNGRLPLNFLQILHESNSYVSVEIPESFVKPISLNSYSGSIYAEAAAGSMNIGSTNGGILLKVMVNGEKNIPSIYAITRSGSVELNGKPISGSTSGGTSYDMDGLSGQEITISSQSGKISIITDKNK